MSDIPATESDVVRVSAEPPHFEPKPTTEPNTSSSLGREPTLHPFEFMDDLLDKMALVDLNKIHVSLKQLLILASLASIVAVGIRFVVIENAAKNAMKHLKDPTPTLVSTSEATDLPTETPLPTTTRAVATEATQWLTPAPTNMVETATPALTKKWFKVREFIIGKDISPTYKAFSLEKSAVCLLANGETVGIEEAARSGILSAPATVCLRSDGRSIFYAITDTPVDQSKTYTEQPFSIYGNDSGTKMNISIGTPGSADEVDINHFRRLSDGGTPSWVQEWASFYLPAIMERRTVVKQLGKTDTTSQYGPLYLVEKPITPIITPTP